jgi:hypothetical protein
MFLWSRREGIFLIKAGTVKELAQFENMLPRDVYNAALRIVSMLDREYGAERDVDNGDGGFVLVVENVQDLSLISQRYMKLDDNQHEAVDVIKSKNGTYLNVFFLCNNEFGINIFIPMDIAPQALLRGLFFKNR